MEIQSKTIGLVVNAPELFARPDFMAWLNDPSKRILSYHPKGKSPDEYSDVVVLVDGNYEGDSSHMPDDIWTAICKIAYDTYCGGDDVLPPSIHSHITVRLTNLN